MTFTSSSKREISNTCLFDPIFQLRLFYELQLVSSSLALKPLVGWFGLEAPVPPSYIFHCLSLTIIDRSPQLVLAVHQHVMAIILLNVPVTVWVLRNN